MRKLFALSIATLFSQPLIADEEIELGAGGTQPGVVQQQITKVKEKVRSKAARIEEFGAKNPGGFFLTAGFLYWQAHEDGLEYAVSGLASAANVNTAQGKTYEPKFAWSPGFSVGAGYTLPVAIIDLGVYWSRLFTHGNGNAKMQGSNSLFPILDYPGLGLGLTNLNRAETRWHLHYNVIDMLFSREFKVNRFLYMEPSGGLRLAWINQNYHIDYDYQTSPQNTTQIHLKNDFRGVGACAALDAYWQLHRMFSIFAKGGFSLFQGKFRLREMNTLKAGSLTSVNTTYVNTKDEIIRIVPSFEASLGARFEIGQYHSHNRFELLAAWEYVCYFRQNQLFLFESSSASGKGMRERGDLSFQGLTLEAAFHF